MTFWDRAENIDRRLIYFLLAFVVCFALIRPIGLAVQIKPETRMVYDAVENLSPGDIVWVGAEYGPSNIPELEPALTSFMRQALRKNVRIVAGSMWASGGQMIENAWSQVRKDFPDKKYGVDFVNIGYKPGGGVLLEKLVADVDQAAMGRDHYNNRLSDLPLMKEFKSLKQAKLIFVLISGSPGDADYRKHVTDVYKIPLAVACVAVNVTGTMPFLQSGQIVGLVGGMTGAAEYEVLVKKPGKAVAGMDAQSLAHVLIIFFILFGNLGYVLSGKYKARK